MAFVFEDQCLKVSLRVRSVEQIFDVRDPAPFREKDLDDDFARYLILAVKSHPNAEHVEINIHSPSNTPQFSAHDLDDAIKTYFNFEASSVTQDLKSMLNDGRTSLMLGLAFLITCESIAFFLIKDTGVFGAAIKQGLTVIGWVALWKPVNTFLYEWWPLRRRRVLLKKLEAAKVNLESGPAADVKSLDSVTSSSPS